MMDFDQRNLACGRRKVIGKICRENISRIVVDDFFQECVGKTLSDRAMNLSVGNHGIDQPARILRHQKFFNKDLTGLDVDLDHRDMASVRKRAGGIIGCAFSDAGADLALEAMNLMISGARELMERDDTIGPDDASRAPLKDDIIGRGFEQKPGHNLELRSY